MRAVAIAGVLAILLGPLQALAQFPPDLGPVTAPIDELLGELVPPLLNTTNDLLGQNITREDVRLFLDMNITHGDLGILGLLVGSSNIQLEAKIHLRVEMRVISSERIKEAVIGNNPYNVSAENSTFLLYVYLPAEVFRLTLTAEAIALFQAEQERALAEFIQETVPELDVVRLDVSWSNVLPTEALTDFSLTEPPIVVEIDAILRYLRVESVPSLLALYFGREDRPTSGQEAALALVKKEAGAPLRTRDFFAAAAYTQLVNLSMQPGWSLDVTLRVPRGFTFEYFSENVEVSPDRREARFRIDGSESDTDVKEALLASLTQRRAVALALFSVMWLVALLLVVIPRGIYVRRRVPRLLHVAPGSPSRARGDEGRVDSRDDAGREPPRR